MGKMDIRSVATLERILGEKEWLVGDTFSVADVAVGAYLNYVPIFFRNADLSATPNTVRYMQRCAERPEFVSAFGVQHANLVQAKCAEWLAKDPSSSGGLFKKFG